MKKIVTANQIVIYSSQHEQRSSLSAFLVSVFFICDDAAEADLQTRLRLTARVPPRSSQVNITTGTQPRLRHTFTARQHNLPVARPPSLPPGEAPRWRPGHDPPPEPLLSTLPPQKRPTAAAPTDASPSARGARLPAEGSDWVVFGLRPSQSRFFPPSEPRGLPLLTQPTRTLLTLTVTTREFVLFSPKLQAEICRPARSRGAAGACVGACGGLGGRNRVSHDG